MDDGTLVIRLDELAQLLVAALEELEEERTGAAVAAIIEAGEELMAIRELAHTNRRIVWRVAQLAIQLVELGEEVT